jgi:hypothetical protein
MIRSLFRVLVATTFVLVVAAAVGLFIMAGVASTHDVVRIPVPKSSYLATMDSVYTVAYIAPMDFDTYRSIDRVAEVTARKGLEETNRNDHEIVYQGSFPGVTYYFSYILSKDIQPNTLAMVTAVQVRNKKGHYLLYLYRPIYRLLGPYLLDRAVQAAPD